MHFYEPAQGHRLPHDPFNAIVGPRPIGWISTRSPEGVPNLAPYSFFNGFCYEPHIIGFASIGMKDTLANVRTGSCFVWNLATRALAEAVNASSAPVPASVDEFALAGLTPVPSRIVEAPRVAESPVALECRLTQILQLSAASGRLVETWLVLGEVVGVHIDEALLVDGIYDTALARPILRAGGLGDYFEVKPEAKFTMVRPSRGR